MRVRVRAAWALQAVTAPPGDDWAVALSLCRLRYTVRQLALAGRIVAAANPHRRVPSYVDVGRAILGDWTMFFIYPGVVLTLLGVCAVYMGLIGGCSGVGCVHGPHRWV